jgi:sulfur relay (sulfurtransferase) complex TusBCD TusD component (DsrE family)
MNYELIMTLGILVTTDKYKDDIVGIAEAAVERGHRIIIFFMDEGCRLITDKKIVSLKDRYGVSMSLCDYNRKKMGILDKDIPEGIICGSQYDNAVMNRESDKVIVF